MNKAIITTGRLRGIGTSSLRAELIEKTTTVEIVEPIIVEPIIVEEPVTITVVTIKDMLEDDYRDMVNPLLNLFRNRRNR